MGLYIKGMEMPTVEDEFVEVLIFGDGKVIQTGKSWRCNADGKCYYESITPELFYHAIKIPEPHGDLIDRDKLRAKEFIHDSDAYAVVMSRDIRNAPTIIPASEEGE